jgi:serine/threonine protein kinase
MLFSYLSRLLSLTFFFLIEYLSPELIFNLGHNHASDIWALGVIIYEMLMAVTPFAPKRPDNVTELFTNIAMVKKNGLVLSSRIDQHADNPQARILISQILKADPAE